MNSWACLGLGQRKNPVDHRPDPAVPTSGQTSLQQRVADGAVSALASRPRKVVAARVRRLISTGAKFTSALKPS